MRGGHAAGARALGRLEQYDQRGMKDRDKPKKLPKKQPQKTLKEKRAEKRAAEKGKYSA